MRSSMFILVAFGFENLATLSLAVNLFTYFHEVMHFDISDAANHLTNYMGTSYILAIFMAILADTYLGRFKTVLISLTLEFLGLALLTIQAAFPKLKPPKCANPNLPGCVKVSGSNEALLFIGLYVLALGSAGLKAALPSHGADQFEEKDPKEAKQMSTFFNTILLAVCTGGSVSLTLVVWVQDQKGWGLGLGIATMAIFVAFIIFAAGLPFYRIQVIEGTSAIIEVTQVYVAAIRNRKFSLPEDPAELYEINKDKEAALKLEFLPHRDVFRFLDKAAIQPKETSPLEALPSPWKLCRLTQVENAKVILGMLPIFGCTIIMTLCLAQLQTFSINQSYTMDRRLSKSFDIPPASLPIIPIAFLILIVPVYDRIIVPFLRKFTGIPTGVTYLQRVGVGLVLSAISMAVAAIVEVKRKGVARSHDMLDAYPIIQPLPISTFWLSFQFFIFGIADMFTYVGLLEFFYSEAPKALKSLSTCFLWTSMAFGYYCSTVVVKIVNDATKKNTRSGGWLFGNNINRNHLNLFYWLLSILSIINFCVYLVVARWYKYRPQSPMEIEIEKSKE
ncbi:hypothetical protein UlMin_018759 [Ulmus minor]